MFTIEFLGSLETVEDFADVVASLGGVLEARVLPHRLEPDRPDVPLLMKLRSVLRNRTCVIRIFSKYSYKITIKNN